MTVGVGTELGVGTGLGAELAAGTGVGIGSGTARAFAALEIAGSSAEPTLSAALEAVKGTSGTWLNATAGNGALIAGKESFKANWQAMLRAWGAAAHTSDETWEQAAGQSGKTDAEDEGTAGPSAGSTGAALAFVGGEAAQSTLVVRGRNGSTASAAVPANSAASANQPAPNGTKVAAGTKSAVAWSAIKTTGNSGSSSGNSKIERWRSFTQNAGVQGQTAQAANEAAGSQVDASPLAAQAAVPFEATIQRNNLIESAGPRFTEGVDDRVGVPAAAAEQPARGFTVAVNGTNGADSTVAASAVTNSSVCVRATGQIASHVVQTQPSNRAMNSGAAAVGTQDDEQGELAALPQSTLTAAAIAKASVPRAVTAMGMETSPGIDEHKPTAGEFGVGGFAAHRGFGEASGAKPASVARTPAADKPGTETGIGSPQSSSAKMAHDAPDEGANAATSQQNGSHVVAAQNPGIETSAMVRDPAGTHGLVTSGASAGSSTSTGTPAAAQETFAALDAGTTVGAPSWVHAGGRQAEAGFEDPALGWVGVRADLSGGSVHAAVVAGSTEAAEALSGHLAGLSTYLSENQTPVATLTMAAPGNSGIEAGFDQSVGQGMGQGMQQSAEQHGEQNQAHAFEMGSQPGAGAGASVSATSAGAPASGFDVTAYAREGRGTHISVMA